MDSEVSQLLSAINIGQFHVITAGCRLVQTGFRHLGSLGSNSLTVRSNANRLVDLVKLCETDL